jgi:transglutaminase-like putative cysteine protease
VRYEITYRCRFDYEGTAAENQNELRVVPSTDALQAVQHARVTTRPGARVLTTSDYWGTRVDAFGVRAPHDSLEVVVEATVDCSPPPRVRGEVPLSALADQAFRDEHRELLDASPMVVPDESVARLAEEVAADAPDDVVSVARRCADAVAERIRLQPGATAIGTPVGDVLTGGVGACQDRAHVVVALARLHGIPARYVSGYVTTPATCDVATTHAWVEVAVPGEGWHSLDPAVDGNPTDDRIVIGRARDYGDVAPVRGTYIGGAAHEPVVDVEVDAVVRVT